MDEGIDALVSAGRALVISIQGAPSTGKTCLAHLIHGNLGFNQRYFLDPTPQIITSVYPIGGVSYLVQTVEHANTPCDAVLRVNFALSAGVNDGCCDAGVHCVSVATRVDVDYSCLSNDFYSSFADGYVVNKSNFKKVYSLRNDLLIDWKRVYQAYGMRHVKNNHVRHFLRSHFGITDLMTWLLETRSAICLASAQFYTSLVFQEKNVRKRRFYECRLGIGALIVADQIITPRRPGHFLGLTEVLLEQIPFRQTVAQLPYVLAFDAFFGYFNYVSQLIEVEYMHFGANHLLATASTEKAEFLLSFLPENIAFSSFPRLMATPDGRSPVFEFNYSFGLFESAKVYVKMILEHCERLSPFDKQFSVFRNDFLTIVHNVFVEKDLSLEPRYSFVLPMLRVFGYKMPTLHRISKTLIRVVDFRYDGRIANPRIMDELLCSEYFYNSLYRQFLGFAAKHMHVLEPVQQYQIALQQPPHESVIKRICAQRRAKFHFAGDALFLDVPVIEEPGLENYLDHCFADFQVLGTRTMWYAIACQHALPVELPEYKELSLAAPYLSALGDHLLLKMTLENLRYGR